MRPTTSSLTETYGLVPMGLETTIFAHPAMAHQPIMADDPSLAEVDPAAETMEVADASELDLATLLWAEGPTKVQPILASVHEDVRAQLSSIVDSASQQLLSMNHAMIAKGIETRKGIHSDVLKVADEIRATVRGLIFSPVVQEAVMGEIALEDNIFAAAYQAADLYTVAEVSEQVQNNIDKVRALLRYVAFYVTDQIFATDPTVLHVMKAADARFNNRIAELDGEMNAFAQAHDASLLYDAPFVSEVVAAPLHKAETAQVSSQKLDGTVRNSNFPQVPPVLTKDFVCSAPDCAECAQWKKTVTFDQVKVTPVQPAQADPNNVALWARLNEQRMAS